MNKQAVIWTGRAVGPLVALALYVFLPDGEGGLSQQGKATAAVAGLMAIWWMTEALPLAATALLPVVLFPLAGVTTIETATAPYASKYIFLFMGGFMLALAIERWNLHRRIALTTLLAVGTQPTRLVAGFMIATALLSMWVSNTATTMIMLPIGVSVVRLVRDRAGEEAESFAPCLMLSIAYASSIGGVSTLVGTPPNIFLASFMESEYGVEIGFGRWMLLGVPLAVVFLTVTWLVLTRWSFPIRLTSIPGGREAIRGQLRQMGPMSRGEITVGIIMALTALAWMTREPLTGWGWLTNRVPAVGRIDDTIIAMTAALALFVIPVNVRKGTFTLDWETAVKLPWGVLLLFGGGLSLAAAVDESGCAEWIGGRFATLGEFPTWALVALAALVVIFLTELTSNLATATTFFPILGGVAVGIGLDPLVLLLPAGLAASYAFMLPVATPPNAIVFASGHVRIDQMVRAGMWLNLIGVILITCLALTLGRWLF